MDTLTLPEADFSALDAILAPLQPLALPRYTCSISPTTEPLQPQEKRSRFHFESSRAGGCFSMHLKSSWDDAQIARFYEWKKAQGLHPDTEQMAQEISARIAALFGGSMPAMVVSAPPRGKTQPGQPHAAHELASAVACELELEFVETLERVGIDDQKYRSRQDNLRDKTTFQALDVEKLRGKTILVIDDVTTTGSTLTRCRSALQGVPTLLLVYVVWH